MTARFLIALGSHLLKRLSPRFFAESGAFFLFGRSCLLNELELFPEKQSVDTSSTMTTKELAEALNVTPQTIRDAVERLGLAKSILQVKIRGQNSYAFTEAQATAIKLELQNHSKVNSLSPKTALEKQLIIRQAMQIQQEIIDELQAENTKLKTTNNLLMHTKKTYTASEIAKELGISSAKKLNLILEEKGIQYKRNGTWLPTAKYSESGYYEIKQEILDNGTVVYNSHITQKGRDFILNFVKAV